MVLLQLMLKENFSSNNKDSDNINHVLKRRGIERTPEGKIILYHATTADKLVKILKNGKLLPQKDTGEGSWGLSSEKTDQEKMSKIYLGSRDFVENKGPASGIIEKDGGRSFILEVKVDIEKLCSDEDSRANDWVDSIDYLGSCAYKGEIDNFKIVSVGEVKVPREFSIELFKSDFTSEDIASKVSQKKEEILEKENRMFKDEGIDLGEIIVV